MLKPFRYIQVNNLREAFDCLLNENGRIYAGGTDILPGIRSGHSPELLVDLKNLKELRGIKHNDDGTWWIGALSTMGDLYENCEFAGLFPALAQAASVMGCYEIQRRATIGGNAANASPGAETAAPLLIYEATAVIEGPLGGRKLPVSGFWQGAGKTVLQKGEILIGFEIPESVPGMRSSYRRLSRIKGMDLAKFGLALTVVKNDNNGCEVRIAVSAMAPTPVRLTELEKLFEEKGVNDESINQAKLVINEQLNPRASSMRSTPEYKKKALGALLEIELKQLLND